MQTLSPRPSRELTELLAERARGMARVPLLLAAVDAGVGLLLARGWHSVLWVPGMCIFSCVLALSVWGLVDRMLDQSQTATHRPIRALLIGCRAIAALSGVVSGLVLLLSALLLLMGAYFR